MLSGEYKAVNRFGQVYKLIFKIKATGKYVVFGGYQLGSQGSKIIIEILNPEDLYPTGGIKEVSCSTFKLHNFGGQDAHPTRL
ncbi:MAG: hypothetical protein PUP90_01585 [Nostoc sp. S4]|nr:hypothetical protein [Nostoc sp. S4]